MYFRIGNIRPVGIIPVLQLEVLSRPKTSRLDRFGRSAFCFRDAGVDDDTVDITIFLKIDLKNMRRGDITRLPLRFAGDLAVYYIRSRVTGIGRIGGYGFAEGKVLNTTVYIRTEWKGGQPFCIEQIGF